MTTPEDPRRDHWDSVYASRSPEEVSWHQARPEISLAFIGRTGAGVGARIVDVGGGASRLVDALLDQGFRRLTVLDVSAEALARARERLGERAALVDWVVADVTRWSPPATFDLWHDRAVFHFLVDAGDRRAYVERLGAAVHAGGHVVIATFASDGPERCSGLPVARYEPETLAAELGAGFRLVEGAHEEHLTPGGKVQRFQFSRFLRE